MKKLEVGKDYVSLENSKIIVIDCKGAFNNTGFRREKFIDYLNCRYPYNWREASEEEVIEAFEKHLIHRYGEDWETVKIKEKRPTMISRTRRLNDGLWGVEISKEDDGWNVWNKNGLLYCNGTWVERLEESENKKNVKNEKLSSDYYGLDWEKQMEKEVIITSFSNVTAEGLTLHLNKKTSLKTGNIKRKSFWISWDKIGALLFDNYTDEVEVKERKELRGQ